MPTLENSNWYMELKGLWFYKPIKWEFEIFVAFEIRFVIKTIHLIPPAGWPGDSTVPFDHIWPNRKQNIELATFNDRTSSMTSFDTTRVFLRWTFFPPQKIRPISRHLMRLLINNFVLFSWAWHCVSSPFIGTLFDKRTGGQWPCVN